MRISHAMLFLLILFLLSGCAYGRNRLNDLADVFDLTLTNGVGVVAQASVINTGVGLVGDVTGLSDGALIPLDGAYSFHGLRGGFIFLGGYGTDGTPEVRERGKYSDAFIVASLFPVALGGHGQTTISKSYPTKFVVGASLGYGVKVGFNPGEFLDLLLGFFGVDIYGDDIRKDEVRPEFDRREAVPGHDPPGK